MTCSRCPQPNGVRTYSGVRLCRRCAYTALTPTGPVIVTGSSTMEQVRDALLMDFVRGCFWMLMPEDERDGLASPEEQRR